MDAAMEKFWAIMVDDSLPDAVMTRAVTTVASFNKFEWRTGYTPFSHPSWPIAAVIAYTITIYALAKWMARRDRFKLVLVTRYHNLLLCIWSLLMCVGATSVLVNAVRRGYTWTDVVCDNRNGRGHLMVSTQLGFWAWSYYVSKFYELFDTVLALLKKKPLTLLHVYHHICMVVTTWLWNHDVLSMHWYAIIVNCLVHVFMYYYYYRASFMTYRPWWRSLITKGQILQFVMGLITTVTWMRASLTNLRFTTSWPFLDFDESVCAGSPKAVAWSQFLTVTLLILFVDFYIKVYHQGRDRKLAAQAEAEAAAAKDAAIKAPASPGGASTGASNGTARPTTPAKKPHKD